MRQPGRRLTAVLSAFLVIGVSYVAIGTTPDTRHATFNSAHCSNDSKRIIFSGVDVLRNGQIQMPVKRVKFTIDETLSHKMLAFRTIVPVEIKIDLSQHLPSQRVFLSDRDVQVSVPSVKDLGEILNCDNI